MSSFVRVSGCCLSPSVLFVKYIARRGENTNFIVFDLTQPRIEPTIFQIQGDHFFSGPLYINHENEKSYVCVCYIQGYGSCSFLRFSVWVLKLFCSFPIGFLNFSDIVVYFIFAIYIYISLLKIKLHTK